MMNPDRAEISILSLRETVVARKDNGHLPRWARVPASILTLISFGAVDQITNFVPTVEAAQPDLAETCRNIVIKETVRNYQEKNGKPGYQENEDQLGDPIKGARIIWVVNNNFNESESKTDDRGQVEKKFSQTACNDETGKQLKVLQMIEVGDGRWRMDTLTVPNGTTKNHTSYIKEKGFDWNQVLIGGSLVIAFIWGLIIGTPSRKSKHVPSNPVTGQSNGDIENLMSQRDDLKLKLENAIQENADLRLSNTALQDENNSLKGETNRLRSEVNTLNSVSETLNKDNQSLSSQLDGLRGRLNQTNQDNSNLRAANVSLESDVKNLKDQLEKLFKELEREKAARVTKAQREANPTTPNPGSTATDPKAEAARQRQSAEWRNGQQQLEKRWQEAKSKFTPLRQGENGSEPHHVLERFKAGMDIIHEISLANTVAVPTMATRVRAGIEYLIPQIWPEYRIFIQFFNTAFNNPEDIARIVYLPEKWRTLTSFTSDQKKDIRRIQHIINFSLHSDIPRPDSNADLKRYLEYLHTQFNSVWNTNIDKLIR